MNRLDSTGESDRNARYSLPVGVLEDEPPEHIDTLDGVRCGEELGSGAVVVVNVHAPNSVRCGCRVEAAPVPGIRISNPLIGDCVSH